MFTGEEQPQIRNWVPRFCRAMNFKRKTSHPFRIYGVTLRTISTCLVSISSSAEGIPVFEVVIRFSTVMFSQR